MAFLKVCALALMVFGVAHGYSGGAPEDVCEDMTPKHPVDPQKTPFPYTVTVDKNVVRSGEIVKIRVSGGKPFKGYLLQVRDGAHAVGHFNVPLEDKYSKTINCFGHKQNAATHKNSEEKKYVELDWTAPKSDKKTYTVYATVAENGGVFWVHVPTAKINVH